MVFPLSQRSTLLSHVWIVVLWICCGGYIRESSYESGESRKNKQSENCCGDSSRDRYTFLFWVENVAVFPSRLETPPTTHHGLYQFPISGLYWSSWRNYLLLTFPCPSLNRLPLQLHKALIFGDAARRRLFGEGQWAWKRVQTGRRARECARVRGCRCSPCVRMKEGVGGHDLPSRVFVNPTNISIGLSILLDLRRSHGANTPASFLVDR